MNEINTIVSDIKKGNIKPIYFLMGEESYYIDKISDFIEQNILDESERGFNQQIMYGRDSSIEDIVASAKRYPMMSERQVLIVKEAQFCTQPNTVILSHTLYVPAVKLVAPPLLEYN